MPLFFCFVLFSFVVLFFLFFSFPIPFPFRLSGVIHANLRIDHSVYVDTPRPSEFMRAYITGNIGVVARLMKHLTLNVGYIRVLGS